MLRAAVLAAFVIVCGCQKPRDVVTARQLMQARNDGERVVLSGLVRNPRIQTPSGANSYTSFDVLDGTGHVYVSSPKGILSGVASCDGTLTGTRGAATWASPDGGKTFGSKVVTAGTANGGGDTDTQVGRASCRERV